jgi:hypothetical protein
VVKNKTVSDMKKAFFLTLSLIFSLSASFAQDAEKDYKDAKKAFNTYMLDPTANKPKLKDAVDAIDRAMGDAAIQKLADAWITKGKIYNEIASQITMIRQTQLGKIEDLPKVSSPAVQAAKAFMEAIPVALKKFETKDALTGLQATQSNLSNLGIEAYEGGKYQDAYDNFNLVLASHDVLKKNATKSALDEDEKRKEQLYITGLAALGNEKSDVAKPLFEELYKAKYNKAAIYEALYQIESAKDANAAYVYLEEGRKLFPDETSLIFADINHHLKLGKLDALIDKLKTAIAKEPNNVSLYTVLGSVYDNLFQKTAETDKAKADEYFKAALDYYNQAAAKDPKNVDAVYSIGALYYNVAATITQKMNALENDYSKEGLKKYKEMRDQVFAEFDKALPYFKKAESLDANDTNTLIALKEIFAKKNDLTVSSEFKKRLETVQGGGKNAKSYFNE